MQSIAAAMATTRHRRRFAQRVNFTSWRKRKSSCFQGTGRADLTAGIPAAAGRAHRRLRIRRANFLKRFATGRTDKFIERHAASSRGINQLQSGKLKYIKFAEESIAATAAHHRLVGGALLVGKAPEEETAMYFPVSGVEVFPLWPVACAFGISVFCSMSGVSGAFLLLPYQMSVLGYVAPGVSATNQIFNILACPAGVWRYAREKRLLVPLALFIALGTLPGVFIGAILRLTVLASAKKFMIFVALVLLYLGVRMLRQKKRGKSGSGACEVTSASWKGFSFNFSGETYHVDGIALAGLSFIVGIIGGTYGIGGGAIMVPFLVAFFGLPVYAIAGASLFATFLTSIAGVAFYSLLAWLWQYPWASPDWWLGALLGIGGIMGMYCGAALQKYMPPQGLRFILLVIIFFMAAHYLIRAFTA